MMMQTNLRHRTKSFKKGDEKNHSNYTIAIEDFPGNWVCQLRKDGKVEREFRFVVNADGTVPLHPEQQGDDGLWFPLDHYRLIATYFPKPNDVDFSFQPAAIKKGGFFGHAWKHPDAWKDMFAALPPAVGSSEPKVPPGAK
jgi:hypothetical protein